MKHTYKILVFLLTLAMLFSMTAMAVEPETATCEEGCCHAHEEDAAAPAALEWECSSHNIRVTSYTNYGAAIDAYSHWQQTVAVEYCTNSGCSYRYEYPGAWNPVDHTLDPGTNTCFFCGYMFS